MDTKSYPTIFYDYCVIITWDNKFGTGIWFTNDLCIQLIISYSLFRNLILAIVINYIIFYICELYYRKLTKYKLLYDNILLRMNVKRTNKGHIRYIL